MTRASLVLALFLAAPDLARAHELVATPCDGSSDGVTAFAITDTVCVAGTVDLDCDDGAGANVYVVPHGADPFAAAPIRVTEGTFTDVVVLAPPVAPAVWDLYLDERCDGMDEMSEDLLVEMAFEVGGDLSCEPPGPVIDPGLGNHATCRGACGSGCPDTCAAGTPETVCVEDAGMCRHQECVYETMTCSTHEACRIHDDCYDRCVRDGGGFWCHRQCDLGCIGQYGLSCGGWAVGQGPSDGMITYYGDVVTTGATHGLCSGGC